VEALLRHLPGEKHRHLRVHSPVGGEQIFLAPRQQLLRSSRVRLHLPFVVCARTLQRNGHVSLPACLCVLRAGHLLLHTARLCGHQQTLGDEQLPLRHGNSLHLCDALEVPIRQFARVHGLLLLERVGVGALCNGAACV